MTTRFDVTFRDYVAPTGWTLSRALEALDISTERFDYRANDGADGYSHDRVLAIRPEPKLWTVPIIAAHELAHIVLGHTAFVVSVRELGLPSEEIPLAQFEMEAHRVARAVAFGLELTPEEFNRELVEHYITAAQNHAEPISDECAIRLARATLDILKAGRVPAEVAA